MLAIHASTSREELEDLAPKEKLKLFPNGDADLQLGHIVGLVRLAGCDGSDGNFEWKLKKPLRLVKPFKTKGAASIFYVDIPEEYLPADVIQELDL